MQTRGCRTEEFEHLMRNQQKNVGQANRNKDVRELVLAIQEEGTRLSEWEEKACFENALATATLHKEYRYAEGYAAGLMPVLHAWLVDPDGNAVDPTWREPGTAYMGIIFPVKEVMSNWQETGVFCMIDDWHNGWPLLKNGVPKEWRADGQAQ